MKQFNLEEYLKNPSRKVVTKDGRNARIVCTDKKGANSIVAVVTKYDGITEEVFTYTKNGEFIGGITTKYDLFFAPEKHEGYINLYRCENSMNFYVSSYPYDSEESAIKSGRRVSAYIKTVKIEWEE